MPSYVLHHPWGRIIIVEISDNFLIGEQFNRSEDYFPKYEAIPKNKIISMEAFKCFQEDKEDAQSLFNSIFDKILLKNPLSRLQNETD